MATCKGIWVKPVSHQFNDRLAVRFSTGLRPCSKLKTKLHTSLIFTKRKAAVQCSHNYLTFTQKDGHADLQDCRKTKRYVVLYLQWSCAAVIQTLSEVYILQHCMVLCGSLIAFASQILECKRLTLVILTTCMSCSCLATVLQQPCILIRLHKNRKCQNFSFYRCGSLRTLWYHKTVLLCCAQHH